MPMDGRDNLHINDHEAELTANRIHYATTPFMRLGKPAAS